MVEGVHAVLLEDDPGDRLIASRLSKAGLECTAIAPPERLEQLADIVEGILGDSAYPIILMDYRLDDVPQDYGERASYRGGTAAAYVRENMANVPLVLVTTESRWHKWVEGSPSLEGLFDYTVLKEELTTRSAREVVVRRLVSIATGYGFIYTHWPSSGGLDWGTLASILGTEDGASLHDQLGSTPLPKSAHSAASWLLNAVLAFPGIVVGSGDAAALLGIDRASFDRDDVRTFLDPQSYQGAFAEVEPRWWRTALLAVVRDLGRDDDEGSAARGIATELGTDLRTVRRSRCIWCSQAHVDRACSVCGELVDRRHSVPIEDSDRPKWALADVVCFTCVESGRADECAFSPSYSRVVEQVRIGEARGH